MSGLIDADIVFCGFDRAADPMSISSVETTKLANNYVIDNPRLLQLQLGKGKVPGFGHGGIDHLAVDNIHPFAQSRVVPASLFPTLSGQGQGIRQGGVRQGQG